MCKWGTETLLLVPIDPALAYNGEFRWDIKGIDSCIADLVQALNAAGIYTSNSCCGHGQRDGEIFLHDGRKLIIVQPTENSEDEPHEQPTPHDR